jgi:hypothetical protein
MSSNRTNRQPSDVKRKAVFFGTNEALKFFLATKRNREWVSFQDCMTFMSECYPHAWDLAGMINRGVNNKNGQPILYETRPKGGILHGEIRYVGKESPSHLPADDLRRSAEFWEHLSPKQQEAFRQGRGFIEETPTPAISVATNGDGLIFELVGNTKDGKALIRDSNRDLWVAERF